jgi:Tfp pilus assembly protein PilN
MIRTNLSTRPFYNVRAVRVAITALAFVVLAVTLFNAVQIVRLSATQRNIGAKANEAETEAERLRAEAVRIRAQIDPDELDTVAGAASEANAIIDQRTFSWTRLLTQLEATLPADVRVRALRPRLERDGGFVAVITVEGRSVGELNQFVEALEATGAFHDVLPTQEETMEDGLIVAVIEGRYAQSRQTSAAAEAPTDTPSSAEAPAAEEARP